MSLSTAVEEAFRAHQRLLWGLSYRMLGVPADADEVVQEAFVRALARPPDLDRPLKPWLVRVTMNAARDRLRWRRRRGYPGPWLPAPLDVDGQCPEAIRVEPDLPGERLEAISYALLVALERLTPGQRATWLLREVMGLSTAEAAEVLEVRPGTVKVSLHRARKALSGALVPKAPLGPGLAAVGALAEGILTGDVAAVIGLLAEDVVALSDGGGVYHAAQRPVLGAERVARMLIGLARKARGAVYEPTVVGLEPAVVMTVPARGSRFAPRNVTIFGVQDGRILRVWTVLAPRKLARH